MIGAIFIMVSFCVLGIVLGLLEGRHYIKEKNIKNKTLQNARKKSFFRILRIFIETMTWTMLLYMGTIYGKYMNTWIKLNLLENESWVFESMVSAILTTAAYYIEDLIINTENILLRILEKIGIMLIVGVVLIFIAGVILEIELWESWVIANCVIFGILLFIVTECKRKKRK